MLPWLLRCYASAGFHHSAFTFAHESHMASVPIQPNLVPPAALVTFVQKGLQYMEAEANLDPVRTRHAAVGAFQHKH
jgi:transducin (beta)-like 1